MFSKEALSAALSDATQIESLDTLSLSMALALYPYCEPLRRLYFKRLQTEDSEGLEAQIAAASMYVVNRRYLYNLLYSEPSAAVELDSVAMSALTSDYFSANATPEQRASLQELAAKLKAARLKKQEAVVPEKMFVEQPSQADATEENLRLAFDNQNYKEALQILEALHANYPEKSIYFAVQIKFVKTILENSK